MKNNKNNILLFVMILVVTVIVSINTSVVFAVEQSSIEALTKHVLTLEEKNAIFTNTNFLTNPDTLKDVSDKKIQDYENYIEQRFNPGRNNNNKFLPDEQAITIILIVLTLSIGKL